MKLFIIILFCLIGVTSYSQPPVTPGANGRSNYSVVVEDMNLSARANFFLPRFSDTVQAALYTKFDTCGRLIFTYADSGRVYVRKCFPVKYWAAIGSGGGGGGTVTGGINGTQLIGSNIGLGGSNLIQYSAIGLNGFPLTILHNGVNNAAQSDSNSLMLVNRTVASTTTDSLVTPSLTFSVNGRTAFPSAAVNVKFRIDEISNGTFRIASSLNNAAYSTLFSMNRLGVILNNLNIQSQPIGIPGGTGGSNLSWGASAAISNTTGSQNLAIGVNSMLLNTKGAENTAVGYNTLASNDTAVYNTAIGSWALNSNTSGFANTAVGKNALLFNRTGIKNTAIGAGTMEQTTTGGFNSALGEDALLNNTTGTNNVAMGWLSGALNQIGNGNVSIGFNTGTLVASGDNNTFLGTSAGNISPQEDTLSESIAIGHNSITTASNQMVLGSTNIHQTKIFGSQVGSGTDSLYSRKSDGTLGAIAQSSIVGATPNLQATIDVSGTLNKDNTIVNGANTLTLTNTALAGDTAFVINSTSTAASGSAQVGFAALLKGANVNSDELTVAASFNNIHTGAGTPTNYGVISNASGGSLNIGLSVNSTGTASQNFGIYTIAEGATGNNYGLIGQVTSAALGTNNYAVFGLATATAESGTAAGTFAGYFNGRVRMASNTTTGTTTSASVVEAAINLTTGTAHYISSSSVTSGRLLDIAITGTAALTNQTGINISLSGANATGAQTTYGEQISNTHSGTSVNVGLAITTTGGSSNFPLKLVDGTEGNGKVLTSDANGNASWATASGSVTWNGISNPTGDQALTFDVGEGSIWTNSNTTEDLLAINTSTLTTASLFSLNSTSTALASGNNVAEFVMSGANGSSSITATAIRASVTNSGTTNTNIAIDATATGGATDNWAVNATGNIKITTANTTQVTTSAGLNVNANSLTNGTGVYIVSSTLQAGTLAQIVSTSTALAANNEGLDIAISGANGTNAITATGIRSTVTNTNATSGTNIAAQFNASGATTVNWALFTGSATGADGRININNATNIANQVAIFKSLTNTQADGIVILANNETAKLTIGYQTLTTSGGMILASSATGVQISSRLYVGASGTSPTAIIHILAGTTAASSAPLKFTSGTNMTTPEAGSVEYDATELFSTNSTAVRGSIIVVRLNSSSAGTLTLATTYTHYVFTGTTTTWTLPAVSGTTNHIFHIKNRGSGAITINAAAAANEIYSTSAVNTYTVNAGEAIVLLSDGTFFLVE